MLARLKPAEDSKLALRGYGDTRFAQPMAWLMLVWSIWIFLTPMYQTSRFPNWLWPTIASYAIFLVLFYRAHYRSRHQVLWCAFGIGALGFALTPLNPGAQSYMIYACAFIPLAVAPRPAVLLMLGLMSLYATEWLWLAFPPIYIVTVVAIAIAVGLMNVVFMHKVRADAALRLSHEEVRRLAALAERERIGRDLHDLLGHTMSLVALKSDLAGKLLQRAESIEARAAAQREIAEVTRIAREALAQVRAAVTGIRAAGIAAELVSAKLLLESDGIAFESGVDPRWLDGGALPSAAETALAMTVREAVTNIQRHARARRASIALETVGEEAVLRIVDDGRGGAIVPGNGLSGMRERIEAVGGRLRIDAGKGEGTRIEVRVPLAADAADDDNIPAAVNA